jgi:two-component system chemotaxis family response regulator WspR
MEPSRGPHAPVVLLVDDQPIVGEAIRRMLASSPDIQFHYCRDAAQALAMADQVSPTIILQDLVMPDVDGFAMMTRFREHAPTAKVPIIVLSSREDPRDKSRAFSSGASDYLVKLPDQVELIARVHAHSTRYLTEQQRDAAYRELQELGRQLAEKNAILEQLSSIDGLTGIANRRRFDAALDEEWRRATRDDKTLSLILIDVDFFKRYNDRYGHLGGDDCLRQIAAALAAEAHRAGDLVARYGGEEFVVLLPRTAAGGTAVVAEGMRQRVVALALPHEGSEVAAHVTISLGSATLRVDEHSTPQRLIELADLALYDAKKSGRNRHCASAL